MQTYRLDYTEKKGKKEQKIKQHKLKLIKLNNVVNLEIFLIKFNFFLSLTNVCNIGLKWGEKN